MSFDGEAWFGGNMSRDAAARELESLCDGSFLIRTSQSRPGSYTLTVKYVETRHIMIVQDRGSFGFSLPTNFASLQEMIHHFGRTSLACYNAELETTLAHPYKTAPSASASQAYDDGPEEDIYMSNVSALRSNLAKQGRVFQATMQEKQYSESHQLRVKAKQTELKAQHLIQKLLGSQVQLHIKCQESMSDKDRTKVLENFKLLEGRVAEADALEMTMATDIEGLHRDMERHSTMSAGDKPVLPPRSRAPSGSASSMARRQSSASQIVSPIPNPATSPFYIGLIEREAALALLEPLPDGTFLIRKSDRPVDPYTLSLRYEGKTRHIQIKTDGVKFGLAEQLVFHSLETLCDYYMEEPISATIATTLRIPYKSVVVR